MSAPLSLIAQENQRLKAQIAEMQRLVDVMFNDGFAQHKAWCDSLSPQSKEREAACSCGLQGFFDALRV